MGSASTPKAPPGPQLCASLYFYASPRSPAEDVESAGLPLGQAFTYDIQRQLPAAVSSRSPGSLLQEIENAIATFPGNLGTFAASKCEEIDSAGTVLWNLCTRLRRDNTPGIAHAQEIAPAITDVARVFAFLLLCCAHDHGKSATSNSFRLMKVGNKAAKTCLTRKQVDLASKVLEKLAKFETSFQNGQLELSAENGEESLRLSSEYFVLRASLAWQQKQFDIVEHMYKNARSSHRRFDPSTAESLADVLYEMGRNLLVEKQHSLAVKWLDRALESLADQELERLSMDASELRISIIQTAVKVRLELKDDHSLHEARVLVQTLESELGDRLIVLVLRLELLDAATVGVFDIATYSDVLGRIIRTVSISDANFNLVLFHIKKLYRKGPALASKSLDDFFHLRVLADKDAHERKDQRIQKIVIARVWMASGQNDAPDSLTTLEDFLDVVLQNNEEPFSREVILAAHTLFWKQIEANYNQGQYGIAERWCRLALHQVFNKAGATNKAKISRKLISCALERQDLSGANEILASMSDAAKNEPMTRFLMYKLAIRMGLPEVATECLQSISATSKDPSLLYACCCYSMEGNDKAQTLIALQLVLDKEPYETTPVHMPSLIRISIGIISSMLEQSQADISLVEKMCALFERASEILKRNRSINTKAIWTIQELDWFSKNSYSTSIKYISTWPPSSILNMLKSCIAFIEQYPQDLSAPMSEDLSYRRMFCDFSAATAAIALARGEDNIEKQLQCYLDLRRHVASFDKLVERKLDTMEEHASRDMLQKLAVMLTFDFEAACQLKSWDDLGQIILNASICKNMRAYELMADCVLAIEVPTKVLIYTLKKIINEAWALEHIDSNNLARYMRCLFQIALLNNEDVAENLLDQVAAHAEEARETDYPYPSEELDWISSKAFNHAVDLYCADQDDACKTWAGRALNIAHFLDDGGALERILQEKWAGLRFGPVGSD